MNKIHIPKTPNCDNLIDAVLDIIITQNDVCNALVAKEINTTEVVLTFDENKCTQA